MKVFSFIFKIILYTFILSGIFNSSHSKIIGFNYDAKYISNYFSGLVSFDNFDYVNSQKFFKRLDNFETKNQNYSSKFIQSLVNLEKYNEAYLYAKRLEAKDLSSFESNLILGLFEFKKENYTKAEFYFDRLKPTFKHRLIFDTLKNSLNYWLKIIKTKDEKNIKPINEVKSIHNNLQFIQNAFAHCYLDTSNTEKEFQNIINNEKSNFSRYHFFFANHLANKKKISQAKKVINVASETYPRNLLINQFKATLNTKEKNKNQFNCKNIEQIIAEVFYVLANALSATSNYHLSNFYINLSKYLNPQFLSYQSLLAENFLILKKNNKAKNIYKRLAKIGSVYQWYSHKQIALILEEEDKSEKAINYLLNAYGDMESDIYRTFDLANFLRNSEKYEKSIELYSSILLKIEKEHKLYPKVLDRRGIAYERIKNWELAEKDLINSLKISPNDAYVMNYLAYSWIERGENINKALGMLRKANNLKKNDGYITDSLGWALYKLNNFLEAKKYLQLAIVLMPRDPIINDHFADCLWMNNKKIQARYYWKYVLSLDSAEEELKKIINDKLLFGLEKT